MVLQLGAGGHAGAGGRLSPAPSAKARQQLAIEHRARAHHATHSSTGVMSMWISLQADHTRLARVTFGRVACVHHYPAVIDYVLPVIDLMIGDDDDGVGVFQ